MKKCIIIDFILNLLKHFGNLNYKIFPNELIRKEKKVEYLNDLFKYENKI